MLSELLLKLTGLSFFEHRIFRACAAALTASAIVFTIMPYYIEWLKRKKAIADFSETNTTPIFGGVLIIIAVIISSLSFSIANAYASSTLIIMIIYGLIGSIDDFVKIRTRILIEHGKAQKKDYQEKADGISATLRLALYFLFSLIVAVLAYKFIPNFDGHLTVPFVKHEIWYPYLPNWAFILLIAFITTSTANGANFTDGMDTLVSVPLITTSTFIGIASYISGNAIFSKYLLLPYLPGVDELLPICSAIIGAILAYLWYNCPPAEIYLGDSGAIGLGGAIGMMFVFIKAELFLPIIGIIFIVEAFSSVLQICGFKLTRRFRKDHQGKRIFQRAPIHDHFKILWTSVYGSEEAARSKVIWRFHLVSILALIFGSLLFFKIR